MHINCNRLYIGPGLCIVSLITVRLLLILCFIFCYFSFFVWPCAAIKFIIIIYTELKQKGVELNE